MHKDETIILLMLESIDKIMIYTIGLENANSFEADTKCFDATIMNFIVLGEAVGKLSGQFKDRHSNIDWSKINAFRNVLAHDYFGIYPAEVWEIIQKDIPKLKTDLESI